MESYFSCPIKPDFPQSQGAVQNYSLSPEGLRRYINNYELPARLNHHSHREAETILRKGGFVGSLIESHKCMMRTMDHARAHIETLERRQVSVPSGAVFLAGELIQSKGRFVRTWHAPQGGLWGSMIYVSTLLPHTKLLLPLAIGVSCCETFHHVGVDRAEIRWINDVLVDDRKAAGILLEGFHGAVSKEEYNLIGFGINVNNDAFPDDLRASAISVCEYLGKQVDLQFFTYCFLAKLSWNLGLLSHGEDYFLDEEQWPNGMSRHPLLERWCELSSTVGRRVMYGFDVVMQPQYEAVVTGISDSGGLMLRLDDGSETIEYSGEIRYL